MPMRATGPRLRVVGPALAAPCFAACVLPTDPVTGIEIVWSLQEQEASDGDDARRPRTCAGALLERVTLTVTDNADPARTRTQWLDCEVGYQTADEIATLASPVFSDLRPGSYTISALAHGPAGSLRIERSLVVGETRVARSTLDLSPPLVPWSLELVDVEACTGALSLALRYADPARDLADADEDADSALYRQALRSDRGLAVDGAAIPCAEVQAGAHTLLVDPGRYLVAVAVDDRTCEVPVEIRAPDPSALSLDLAKLPCDG
ncbi:MAG: hypothetical protein R3B09_27355 [Nannocystaceae bacterium]